MEDPERLLSATSETGALEREVLTSLRNVKAPARAHQAAWRGIAAGIAVTTVSTATQTTAAAMSPSAAGANAALSMSAKGALAGLAKYAFVAALGSAALGGGAYWAHRQHVTQPVRTVTPVVVAPPQARVAPPVAIATVQPPVIIAEPTPSALHVPAGMSAPRPVSRSKETELLAAESALLASARAELRKGEIPAAQRSLNRLRARFPKGALAQERDVLGIELLSARGDSAAAKRAARAFVTSYPDSPHSTRLRTLLATP
jgi:hypothetical protein